MIGSQLTLPSRAGWSEPRAKLDTAQPAGLVGAWRFGLYGPDSAAEALRRAKYNKAALGPRGLPNAQVGGAPSIAADYFGFVCGLGALGDFIRCAIMESATLCLYAVFRSPESAISGANVPIVCGHYGSNAGFGFNLFYASTGVIRVLAYDASGAGGTQAIKSASLTVTNNTQGTFRAIYLEITPSAMTLINLTGDSATNAPTPTTMSGRVLGALPFSIGSAYQVYSGKQADIHAIRYYQGVTHSAAQRAAVYAELQAGARSLSF